jgi:two-component system OmpR family response regulator
MSDKILIVDDEPSNRNILSQELAHEGYSVLAASDGREALRQVESSRPDLIILDYMMPDLSGLKVLRELRKRQNDTCSDDNGVWNDGAGGRGHEGGGLRFHHQAL